MFTLQIKTGSYELQNGKFIPKFTLYENSGANTTVTPFSYPESPYKSETRANEAARHGALKYLQEHFAEGTLYHID